MPRSWRLPALLIASCSLAAAALAQVVDFAKQTPPPAPDYALSASWAAGPAGPSASSAVPGGATPAVDNASVDVFFIHPTTFRSDTKWNQDVGDTEVNSWTDASTIARQASVFNGCCQVYAPRYRQASFLYKEDGRDRALDLAYSDIARAFDYYIHHYNRGRPFIVAGHSQGALMGVRLLKQRIDGKPLAARMVAAYIVGMNVAEGDFTRQFKQVAICDKPAQTGCVIQWNSVLNTVDLNAARKRSEQAFIDKYGDVPAKMTLCINPLTFDRALPSATADRHLGAIPDEPGSGPLLPLVSGAVAAKCEQGFLIVDPDVALRLKPLPGGSMHYHDFGLFFANVRANANLRVQSYLKDLR